LKPVVTVFPVLAQELAMLSVIQMVRAVPDSRWQFFHSRQQSLRFSAPFCWFVVVQVMSYISIFNILLPYSGSCFPRENKVKLRITLQYDSSIRLRTITIIARRKECCTWKPMPLLVNGASDLLTSRHPRYSSPKNSSEILVVVTGQRSFSRQL